MPSTIAHAVSASLIALTAAHIAPDETPYLLAAVTAASLPDLDHPIIVIKHQTLYRRIGYNGNLHWARSVYHELFGLLVFGALCLPLLLVDQNLARVMFVAFAIHLAQDWVMGKSYPLAPIDRTEVQFYSLTFKQKVLADAILIMVFGVAWLLYLSGRL